MADKHDRFRRLERARPESLADPAPPMRPRFEPEHRPAAKPPPGPASEESPAGEPAPADPDALAARLREERRQETESGVALDEPNADTDQPFLRCAKCEADSHRSATRCLVCGERLDTEEQGAFNSAFWAKRRRERAQEQVELAQLKGSGAAEPLDDGSGAMRDYGAALAAQVAERERARLGWMDEGRGGDLTPVGLRLLNRIPDPRWRLGVALAVLVLALVLGYFAFSGPREGRNPIPMLLFFVLMILFLPSRRGGFSNRRRWF